MSQSSEDLLSNTHFRVRVTALSQIDKKPVEKRNHWNNSDLMQKKFQQILNCIIHIDQYVNVIYINENVSKITFELIVKTKRLIVTGTQNSNNQKSESLQHRVNGISTCLSPH